MLILTVNLSAPKKTQRNVTHFLQPVGKDRKQKDRVKRHRSSVNIAALMRT